MSLVALRIASFSRTCVQATDQHPLYITTSSLGGAGRGLNPMEVSFAGGDESHGTLKQPYTLKWTPDACAPATSCFVQR